jgi:hypothetical protein
MNIFTNKNKLSKLSLAALIVLMIGGLFYWYEWRPAEIRRECSWVKVTVPEQPRITKEEALASMKSEEYLKCLNDNAEIKEGYRRLCDLYLKEEQEHVPEKIYYKKSQKEQYEFCTHEKGL